MASSIFKMIGSISCHANKAPRARNPRSRNSARIQHFIVIFPFYDRGYTAGGGCIPIGNIASGTVFGRSSPSPAVGVGLWDFKPVARVSFHVAEHAPTDALPTTNPVLAEKARPLTFH